MNLLEKIDKWYDEGKHWEITKEVEDIPEAERSYELWGQYAVALNNIGNYQKALEALAQSQDAGKDDPAWYYRKAFALQRLREYETALELFQQAIKMGRDEDYMHEHVKECQDKIAKEKERAEARLIRLERRQSSVPGKPFADFDFSSFWDDDEYALKEYVSPSPTDEIIQELENELGYKLPESYIWLMKQHNGGIPFHTCCPCDEPSGWAEDHIAITGIMGIGREKANTIGGSFGSRFWIEEWGYPDIGVAICDCPSAGHDMVFLDYRYCGPEGEPEVVYIDQEADYEITYLAADFEDFIRMLRSDEEFEEE